MQQDNELSNTLDVIEDWFITFVIAAMLCGWCKIAYSLTWLQFAAALGGMLLIEAARRGVVKGVGRALRRS
jgi:hypothetical protein